MSYIKKDLKEALRKDSRSFKDDVRAEKELRELDVEKQKGEITKVKHRLLVISIYILWFIAIVILIIRLLHFVTPEGALIHYLNEEQIQTIDKVLFSGAIGGWMTKYGEKVFQ